MIATFLAFRKFYHPYESLPQLYLYHLHHSITVKKEKQSYFFFFFGSEDQIKTLVPVIEEENIK
jgi:hypothetical protein